jgi:hypothetical protein
MVEYAYDTETKAGRVGYTSLDQLGDVVTQQRLKEKMALNPFLTFEEKLAIMGDILEGQRKEALAGTSNIPGVGKYAAERYYNNELQKWKQDYVELSSGVHHGQTKAPAGTNIFERQGDVAVVALKGSDPDISKGDYPGRIWGLQQQNERTVPEGSKSNYSPSIKSIQDAGNRIGNLPTDKTDPNYGKFISKAMEVLPAQDTTLSNIPPIGYNFPEVTTDYERQAQLNAQLRGVVFNPAIQGKVWNVTESMWKYKRTDRRNPVKTAKQLQQAIFTPAKKQPATKTQKFVVEELWGTSKPAKPKTAVKKKSKSISAGSVFEEMFGKQVKDKSLKSITKKPKRSKSIVEEMFGKRR